MSDTSGSSDEWFCTSCGVKGISGNRFCSSCGAARSNAPDALPKLPPPPTHAESLPPPPTSASPTSHGVTSPSPKQRKSKTLLYVAIIVAILVITGAVIVGTRLSASDTSTSTTKSTLAVTGSTVSTLASTTTTTAPPPTTALPTPTELSGDFSYEPDKCGIDASPKPYAHSSSQTYEVTATIGLWSAASTNSQMLKLIPVLSYGPGGIGCPDGLDPKVTIICQVTNGQSINGPFGNDPIWLKTTYDGATGYVPDQWVDTEWDTGTIRRC